VRGLLAEDAACAALVRDGFSILARRLRTKAGEIDIVAQRPGLLVFGEVKCRPDLVRAAYALGARQQGRLMAAAEIALAEHPDWGGADVRFDVLLVNRAGMVRRVADAFRQQ
jgi:putative endonuclease